MSFITLSASPTRRGGFRVHDAAIRGLRVLIWLYFWLILFEGALRKWVFPSFSDWLLVIRDPIALFIYWRAFRAGIFQFNLFLMAIFLLAGIGFVVGAGALFGTESNLNLVLIVGYGVRTFFMHLPLIFILPRVLSEQDVVRCGKWCLWLTAPMTLLMAAQYNVSPDHWLNATTMGQGAEQIAAALGKIRPPGTFSFITGPVAFFPMAVAFLFYGIVRQDTFSWALKLVSGAAVLLVLPISGSRSLVLACGMTAVFGLIALIRLPKQAGRFTGWAVATATAGLLLLTSPIGQEAIDSFSTRWNEASDAEGERGSAISAISTRMTSSFTEVMSQINDIPIGGYGIGVGTNAGTRLATGSIADFRFGEAEWTRVLMEMGPVLGFAYLALRLALCLHVLIVGWASLVKGHPLPWLLAGCCWLQLLNGQTGQPTALGFMVLTAGLALAASNSASDQTTTIMQQRQRIQQSR